MALRGLLGITFGVLVLAWPGISALALLYVIGGYAVGLGFLCVVASFRLPLDGRDTALMSLTGLVAIVFGIVIFAKPGAGALAVLALIAAFALVTGISELVVAIGGKWLLERKVKSIAPPRDVAEDDARNRRIDSRSAHAHVLGAGDQVAGPTRVRRPATRPRQRRPLRRGRLGSFLAASVIGVAYESERAHER